MGGKLKHILAAPARYARMIVNQQFGGDAVVTANEQ